MTSPDFSAWRKAWDKIENLVHKCYHLAALLTGCRPTELAMIRESDIDLDARRMIIAKCESWKRYLAADHWRDCFRAGVGHQRAFANRHDEGLRGMKSGEVGVIERNCITRSRLPILSFRAFVKLAIARAFRSQAMRSGISFRSIAVSLEISEMLSQREREIHIGIMRNWRNERRPCVAMTGPTRAGDKSTFVGEWIGREGPFPRLGAFDGS